MLRPSPLSEPTLLRRLMLALLPALVLLAAVGAFLDYQQARHLADEAYDHALGNAAIALATHVARDEDHDVREHASQLAAAVSRSAPQATIEFAVRSRDGSLSVGPDALAALAEPAGHVHPVFRDVDLDRRVLRVATFRTTSPQGDSTVVVAEGVEARRGAARRAIQATMRTNLIMIVAVLLVVFLGVRVAIRPLNELGRRAAEHDADQWHRLSVADVPREVRPLVDGINRLIDRLRDANQAQQVFLNASAHQLRTPMAGLQAQIEVLAVDARHHVLAPRILALGDSVRRMSRVTLQMLSLARADAFARGDAAAGKGHAPVNLQHLLEGLAADHLDDALRRGIDLGLETRAVSIQGEHWMLRELTANLVDNALRYAPPISQVTLRCGPQWDVASGRHQAFIEVEDDGPGIPVALRDRVFERFVRLSEMDRIGSGLGLSIVREVARFHGAVVRIHDGGHGRGTRIRVSFPSLLLSEES